MAPGTSPGGRLRLIVPSLPPRLQETPDAVGLGHAPRLRGAAAPGVRRVAVVDLGHLPKAAGLHGEGGGLQQGKRRPEELTEAAFSERLFSAGVPDPDLIIRPSGEVRISNFLLWQSAYAEYYFTDVLWPDFDEAELERAIASYNGRSRRYGGVKP